MSVAHFRGDIARIHFYMEWAYPGHAPLADASRKLFEVWAQEDLVDESEREWARIAHDAAMT